MQVKCNLIGLKMIDVIIKLHQTNLYCVLKYDITQFDTITKF